MKFESSPTVDDRSIVVDPQPKRQRGVHRLVGSRTMSHGPSCVPVISTNAALLAHGEPVEVVTDRAPALRAAIDELMPAAFHNTERYANNRVECDHGRFKARLRPMWGLKHDHNARVIVRGHTRMQNMRRGHYELGVDTRPGCRVATAFTELARTI